MSENTCIDILLVEDSPNDAELVMRAMKKEIAGLNLKHVEDGAEALDFIFCKGSYEGKPQENPRLVLLDLNMPKISGLEVLTKIRADKKTRRIPVVVFSSSKEDSDVKNCYDLGVNSYIVKPVEFKDFTQTLSSLSHYWLRLNLPPE